MFPLNIVLRAQSSYGCEKRCDLQDVLDFYGKRGSTSRRLRRRNYSKSYPLASKISDPISMTVAAELPDATFAFTVHADSKEEPSGQVTRSQRSSKPTVDSDTDSAEGKGGGRQQN
jgi:hypothetical protein